MNCDMGWYDGVAVIQNSNLGHKRVVASQIAKSKIHTHTVEWHGMCNSKIDIGRAVVIFFRQFEFINGR